MDNKKGILLETGTNEFEIVEFSMGNVAYGINVAKVREVINGVPVTKIASAHPYVDGVFSLRGKVMPLINLAKFLGAEESTSYKIIVSEINNFYAGFKVDEVSRIHRISWSAMEPPPNLAGSNNVVGIVKMQDRLILLLDFEKILAEVNPDLNEKMKAMPTGETPEVKQSREQKTILIAEDSHMLRSLLMTTLNASGYTHIVCTENGKQAWETLQSMKEGDQPLEERLHAVITDIEMPQMDGHHLTKSIKENEKFKYLPVIIFSSLINDEMRRKGESIGASAQVTKPEIVQLITILDKLVGVS